MLSPSPSLFSSTLVSIQDHWHKFESSIAKYTVDDQTKILIALSFFYGASSAITQIEREAYGLPQQMEILELQEECDSFKEAARKVNKALP